MLKRGYTGVYHHFSVKNLDRYMQEFSGWRNSRPLETESRLCAGCAASACAMKTSYRYRAGADAPVADDLAWGIQ